LTFRLFASAGEHLLSRLRDAESGSGGSARRRTIRRSCGGLAVRIPAVEHVDWSSATWAVSCLAASFTCRSSSTSLRCLPFGAARGQAHQHFLGGVYGLHACVAACPADGALFLSAPGHKRVPRGLLPAASSRCFRAVTHMRESPGIGTRTSPICSIFSLPAAPLRTDDWPIVKEIRQQ
jgi:hypothetical protein